MDLKAGHTIQILRVGADRCGRPRKLDSLGICDEYETQLATVFSWVDAVNNVKVLF